MTTMASFTFFFLCLVSFSSFQIHARESKHFSKFMHYSSKESISDAPIGEPVLAPAPAPVYTESSENGYGLYGHDTGLFPSSKKTPTTTTTTTFEDENELLNQELDSHDTSEKGYQGNNYNNNGYDTNNYNNDGGNNNYYKNNYRLSSASYVTGNQNKDGYTTYNDKNNNNGYYTNSYNNNNNGYTTDNYNYNGYETGRQGMSDTRFMEGGKYYHDVKNENNHYPTTGYESEMTKTKYPNEFNTMEEYENQEEYQESQDESSLP